MKKYLYLFVFAFLVVAFPRALAQTTPAAMQGPPKVLLVVREEIKPGKMPAHNRHSATFARIFAKLQTPNHRIALVPVAGNENEVIYLTGVDSFAELEDVQKNTDKIMSKVSGEMKAELDRLEKEAPDLHSAMRDALTVFREDLSFGPSINVGEMRYFAITTVSIRPGHDAEYVDYVKSVVNVAREKAKIENFHLAGFQVVSGAFGGTYFFFRPLKSLKEYDENIGMKVRAAMTDDMKTAADKTVSNAVLSSETSTYEFAPRMSYVSKELAAQDPAFWNPKPEAGARPKPKKRPAKPATPPPPPKQ